MVCEIEKDDLGRLRELVAKTVRASVSCGEAEAAVLIAEIVESLTRWFASGSPGFGRKYCLDGETAGFVVVREYRKLTHLFARPEFQSRGIGRALVDAAVAACRTKSPGQKIELNSSSNAAGFYEAVGFRRVGPGVDRAGGCIPYEYYFQHPV